MSSVRLSQNPGWYMNDEPPPGLCFTQETHHGRWVGLGSFISVVAPFVAAGKMFYLAHFTKQKQNCQPQ